MSTVFIQIHYHLKPGGVSTVIQRYNSAFKTVANADDESFIICNNAGKDLLFDNDTKVINIEECGYKRYTSIDEFLKYREIILKNIEQVLLSLKNKNIIFVAHNMSLGKNLALTSAFYELSKRYASDLVKFFSVIHDFAEEGRVDQLDDARVIEENGITIRNQMYYCDAPVHIVVPNKNSYELLIESGFKVSIVTNPINCSSIEYEKNEISLVKDKIVESTLLNGVFKRKDQKICYYPVRLVPRKNIYEAIAMSCILMDSILITGPAGNSPQDFERYDLLNRFVSQYKLPVITDVFSYFKRNSSEIKPSVELFVNASDYILSTSIAEGFGYTLFEPWIQNKMIIARKPNWYQMPFGWNGQTMYSFLPVPKSWIDMDELTKRYTTFYYDCFNQKIKWIPDSEIVNGDVVDFSSLPEDLQLRVLEMVLQNPELRMQWSELILNKASGWPGLHVLFEESKCSIELHKQIVMKEFSSIQFLEAFKSVFFTKIPIKSQCAEYLPIEKHFQSSKYFRLLLSGRNSRI